MIVKNPFSTSDLIDNLHLASKHIEEFVHVLHAICRVETELICLRESCEASGVGVGLLPSQKLADEVICMRVLVRFCSARSKELHLLQD